MEMTGEVRLPAARQIVWDALNAPAILRASIPGCEALDRVSDTEFTATVVAKVGPVKARLVGKVTLSNVEAPVRYRLGGEGQGGMAGFARADIDVELEALDAHVTLLRYAVKAQVGGKLAQVGARLIDATARRMADDFFARFETELAGAVGAGSVGSDGSNGSNGANGANGSRGAAAASGKVGAEVGAASPDGDAAVAIADALAEVGDAITVWIADRIAVVTLNRPAQRNAMTLAMWRAMPPLFAALAADPEVRTVMLTGAGEDFSAGADISEFGQVRASTAQATDYELAVDACCDAIAGIAKPTIAVIRGYCLGGGAHLAMACDFRYAAAAAIFGIPAARLSIIYGVAGTRRLRNLVGDAEAKRILFGAERFDAERALRVGFIDHRAAPTASASASGGWRRWFGAAGSVSVAQADPMVAARAFARTMAENAPLSMAGAKHILNGLAAGAGGLDVAAAERLIDAAAGSRDYAEGRAAFAEKRRPAFEGR